MGAGRIPVDLENQPFNLLTRTSGTVTARFRQLLIQGKATQKMMENAIDGTIQYLEDNYGYERDHRDSQESDSRSHSKLSGNSQPPTQDARKITATKDTAQEQAFATPDKANENEVKNYGCAKCGCLVQRTMAKCPGCESALHWERVGND